MANQSTFDVRVPYCIMDGHEYALWTDRELSRRKVGVELLREEAARQPEDFFRQWDLLPKDGKVTEEELNQAREQYAQMTSRSYRADLENHDLVVQQARDGSIEIKTATYKLREPSEDDLAECKEQSLTAKNMIDEGQYLVALARKLLISHDREDTPASDPSSGLSVITLKKLGQAADERANMDEAALAFALRSRMLSPTECPSGESS